MLTLCTHTPLTDTAATTTPLLPQQTCWCAMLLQHSRQTSTAPLTHLLTAPLPTPAVPCCCHCCSSE